MNGVILKIDFEKAYDKVNWSFLQQTLRMKGFSSEWCALIDSFVWVEVWPLKSTMTLVDTFKQRKVSDKETHYRRYYLI